MTSTGRDIFRRTGVVLAGMLLVGSMTTGAAFAQTDDTTGGGSGGDTGLLTQVVGELTDGGETLTEALTDGGETLTEALTDGLTQLTDALTGGSTSSTSPTRPSGSNTEIIYSPYPVPVFGDYGKRYYGKYYDRGCGCDRYAAPTYVPQVVNATQVSSVPKGGVDTGDGSFQ